MPKYAFEDLQQGTELPFGPKLITKQEIVEFAEEFDPAPFHLTDSVQGDEFAVGLCASGFHTCGIVMRMICDAYLLDSTSEGAFGLEECLWTKPVRPGDTLRGKSIVLSARQSKSRPQTSILRIHHETWNQNDETVNSMITINIFRLRNVDQGT